MVVNFRARGISRDTPKLVRAFTLIKIIKKITLLDKNADTQNLLLSSHSPKPSPV
jgi:hypothetical protein